MKLWKYSGTILSLTGGIHVAFAIIQNWNIYKVFFSDGLVNPIGNDIQKGLSFWFMLVGVLLILFGQTLQYYIKREGRPAPLFLGYALLVFSVAGCVVIPLSGFWFFIPQALIILLARRK